MDATSSKILANHPLMLALEDQSPAKKQRFEATEETLKKYLTDYIYQEKMEAALLRSMADDIKKRDDRNADILILSNFDGVSKLNQGRLCFISHRRDEDAKKLKLFKGYLDLLDKSVKALEVVLREMEKS